MSFIAVFVCSLRMLLGSICVFLSLAMIALAVMFRGRAVGLRSVFVVFGRLIVFIFSHFSLVGY